MSLRILEVRLRGTAAMLMCNVRTANPSTSYYKALKQLTTDKRKKNSDVEALNEKLSEVEWEGHLYFDDKVGPYVPAENLRACVIEGARASRKGKDIERAVMCVGNADKFPLQYKGPRTLAALHDDESFWDVRMVVVSNSRVPRTRPVFQAGWEIVARLAFIEKFMNEKDLLQYIEEAGQLAGIGDGRKLGFGRYEIVSHKVL